MEFTLPGNIPSEIKKAAVWLKERVGVNEWAFPYAEAKQLLRILTEKNFIILGGDVLRVDEDKLEYTSDNWYYNPDNTKSRDENIGASYVLALAYLDSFYRKNGDGYLYIIGF